MFRVEWCFHPQLLMKLRLADVHSLSLRWSKLLKHSFTSSGVDLREVYKCLDFFSKYLAWLSFGNVKLVALVDTPENLSSFCIGWVGCRIVL